MAAPPVAVPLPTRPLPPQPVATHTSHDVILLDDSDGEEVKEQPPAVMPTVWQMQVDSDDDDVRVMHSTTATAAPSAIVRPVIGSVAAGGGMTTSKNGYSLVSTLKDKLFGGWNNNSHSGGGNSSHSSASSSSLHAPTTGTTQQYLGNPPPYSSTFTSSSSSASASDSSSSSCGAFSLCSPSSTSTSPVMKRQRSNDDMGVPPIESVSTITHGSTPTPPIPPPHPNFRLSAVQSMSATSQYPPPLPPLPVTVSSPSASPSTPSAASTSFSSSASSAASASTTAAAASLPTAMSDEELARFLQAEDEAADRRQREQRQQADEAAFQQFQRDQGTCVLCHSEVGAELILELSECGHRMCADCLRTHLQQWNASGSPTCPCTTTSGRCTVVVPERVMRQVLSTEQLNELQERQMKAFLTASSSSYVTCPSCHETFEAIASSSASASAATPRAATAAPGSKETAEDGRELTAEQVEHRNRHRFRCVSCSANFCRLCNTTPYHLGYTCDEYQRYTNAPHCRYCEDVLLDAPTTSSASSGSSSSPATTSTSTSFVSRILRSNSRKEDLQPPQPTKPANVCSKPECLERFVNQCVKLLPGCRHPCDGIRGERHCLPCMYDDCERHRAGGQTRDDYCTICGIESLGQAPSIQLKCGHIFHHACIKAKLDKRWPTPRVTFYFMSCPLCNAQIDHPALAPTLSPLLALRQTVQQKASDRLTFEGNQNDAPLAKGGKYEGRPADYAMDLYAYYMCSHCHQPYFGGRRQCEEAAAARGEESYNEKDLVCGGCVMTEGGGNGCTKHGKEFIEYKYGCMPTTHTHTHTLHTTNASVLSVG